MENNTQFHLGSFVLHKARANSGKTSMVINSAIEIAEIKERKAIVFSLQHGKEELLNFISSRNKKKNNLDEIVIKATPSISVEEMLAYIEQELEVSERIYCVIDEFSSVMSEKKFENRQAERKYIIQCLQDCVVDKYVAIFATMEEG